jgi:hypothetical protein
MACGITTFHSMALWCARISAGARSNKPCGSLSGGLCDLHYRMRSAPLTHHCGRLGCCFRAYQEIDQLLLLPTTFFLVNRASHCQLSRWVRKTQSCQVHLLILRQYSTTTWITGRHRNLHMCARSSFCASMAQATSFQEQIQTPTFSKSIACSIAMATTSSTTTNQVSTHLLRTSETLLTSRSLVDRHWYLRDQSQWLDESHEPIG